MILGVDPGLGGALFFLYDGALTGLAVDMPTLTLQRGGKSKRHVDPHGLATALARESISHAFIEQVWSRPGTGYASAQLLDGYGVVKGALAALRIPYTLVSPQKWKRTMGVNKDKDGARSRASQLLPDCASQWARTKDDGRAEAALIALWGALHSKENK